MRIPVSLEIGSGAGTDEVWSAFLDTVWRWAVPSRLEWQLSGGGGSLLLRGISGLRLDSAHPRHPQGSHYIRICEKRKLISVSVGVGTSGASMFKMYNSRKGVMLQVTTTAKWVALFHRVVRNFLPLMTTTRVNYGTLLEDGRQFQLRFKIIRHQKFGTPRPLGRLKPDHPQ